MSTPLTLQVNCTQRTLTVSKEATLLHVLRNDLALNSPKYGCGLGECGACTVLVDGVAGRTVTTLEGLFQGGQLHQLHPVQQAFIEAQAAQCGYCLNGMLMATVALLQRLPQPSDAQVRAALSHNLCRCGSHLEILAAVHLAAAKQAATGRPALPGTAAPAAP